MARVTVLLAVYNGLPYLPAAIESVLRQTFTDFELLIVDDASTDGSAACVEAYHDPRIRLVRHEVNRGQTASLNRGLALAQGTYIARLDADDVCAPERLERQTRFLDQHPDVAVVGARMMGVDAAGRRTERLGREVRDGATLIAWLLVGVCPLGHPSVMFRRSAVADVGNYDEAFAIGQDYDLWIRLAVRRHAAYVLDEPLVMYRAHARQQSTAARATHQAELRTIHDRLVQRWAPASHAERIAQLLRRDNRFWSDCHGVDDLAAVGRALREMLAQMTAELSLTAAEAATVRRLVYRRVCSPLSLPGVHRSLAHLAGWWRGIRRAIWRGNAVPMMRAQ